MENGQGKIDTLLAVLGKTDSRAFVRAVCQAGSQAVWHMDAVVGPPATPPGWKPEIWEYQAVTFIADQVSAGSLAAALSTTDPLVLQLGRCALSLPALSEHVAWSRKPSWSRYDSIALPWPTVIYELNQPDRPRQQIPPHYLIGDDCPSFFSYERAFRAFFYGDFAGSPGQNVPWDTAVIRVASTAAWLERVIIRPTHMDVVVGGGDVSGARVELNGATYRADARAGDSGQVRLPLPEGLPAGSWLYLSRDRQWLDYRAIGEYGSADLECAGVEVELPDDPETEIQLLLSQGEGQQVEFKRQLPEGSVDSKRTVFKTVAAFANGSGGSVVFGVEKDEATVCGLEDIDVLQERDRLIQLARSVVTPAPDVETRQYAVDGKTILVLSVGAGTDAPYGITPGGRDKPVEFYIRRDATTFPGRPEEIRNSVLARVPRAAPGPPWLAG